jgi:ubiquinone/menaquinone biosynthesis C-methylase UbiE
MKTNNELKELVKEKYALIAEQSKETNETSCCGASSCCEGTYTVFSEDYSKLEGYNADANLGLGCGLPTEYAKIKEGNTVVDLGSGAGNDCFVARAVAGESGKVIGIDLTEAMIDKASINATKLGFTNVEFRLGDIENMPLAANTADVVVSNCVLNLVPDKKQAFDEVFRILKNGGHFSISDVVLVGELPTELQNEAEMYAGCVSGAIQKDAYLEIVRKSGFTNIAIQKERKITLPDEILAVYLNEKQMQEYKAGATGIFSVTLYADKAETDKCCKPNAGCC